jgi:hypothetical protein
MINQQQFKHEVPTVIDDSQQSTATSLSYLNHDDDG